MQSENMYTDIIIYRVYHCISNEKNNIAASES